jgi:hypothetical protein
MSINFSPAALSSSRHERPSEVWRNTVMFIQCVTSRCSGSDLQNEADTGCASNLIFAHHVAEALVLAVLGVKLR